MNKWRILRIQNAKFSGYHFYMNTNIWRDFQICISVPLSSNLPLVKTSLVHINSIEITLPKRMCLVAKLLNYFRSNIDVKYSINIESVILSHLQWTNERGSNREAVHICFKKVRALLQWNNVFHSSGLSFLWRISSSMWPNPQ